MKKRIVTILLSICCAAVVFTGCGSSSGNVKLAQSDYKGIEVAEVTADEVTDEDVEDMIQSTLEENATTTEITDRAVKDGDTVNIDYTGTLDGEEFDGGSAEGYDLEIGSGDFVSGFEEQLIGHEKGEEFDITVTFPEDYSMNEDLAGKETVFAIKINSISQTDVPELTDDFVKSVSENSKTVEEYKKEVREELEAENQQDAEATFADNVMDAVLDKAEITEYDEDKLSELKEESKDYYEQIITMYYGMEMSDYLDQVGQTEEELDEEIEESAKETLKMQMVCEYIAEKEGLEITDEEFDEKLQELAEEDGYDSTDDLIEDYAAYYYSDDTEDTDEDSGEDTSDEEVSDEESGTTEVSDEAIEKTKEEMRSSFLQEKVSDWLVENAKAVEAEDEDEDSEEDASEDEEESGEDSGTSEETEEE